MVFTGGLGLELRLEMVPSERGMREDFILFSESNGRLLVEVPPKKQSNFEELMGESVFSKVGVVTKEEQFIVSDREKVTVDLHLDELISAWKTPLGGSA